RKLSGRALLSHSRGDWFDPSTTHQLSITWRTSLRQVWKKYETASAEPAPCRCSRCSRSTREYHSRKEGNHGAAISFPAVSRAAEAARRSLIPSPASATRIGAP